MVMPEHTCPWGLKALDLLEREGYAVGDHPLTSREETEDFKRRHGVDSTPQVFIDGRRVGGFEDLQRFFGRQVKDENASSYAPVVALFSMAALMALAASWAAYGSLATVQAAEWFIAIAMCLLALQKLKDVEGFSTMFLNYDLLAQRWVRYGYVYPFAEALAGVLMIAGALTWLSVPVALFIGTVGAVSVFKAVYIDKRELTCACVGGDSKVPLGFVSLTENLMMVGMAVWMLAKPAGVGH
ncbi:glutaredoxin [Verticiella sediminum]|uniref:Methylamine utilization protein MauE n=2 Tax=Verticiella sediminum TaxID=1247510 RepID=A0A556B1J6_9BURK|nr:glutaredoxin [Verticiella sediminum]